ncbi:receptor-like protein 15 [Gossypium hirsutum]|uniref:Receptor-like protein 15 n=1 Tax=Gossypium hirsutum TaxID=3635 RepID=A0A1U8KC20_GOSHI|nr:receptor-like protein 15 [Gossypium hirsutum]
MDRPLLKEATKAEGLKVQIAPLSKYMLISGVLDRISGQRLKRRRFGAIVASPKQRVGEVNGEEKRAAFAVWCNGSRGIRPRDEVPRAAREERLLGFMLSKQLSLNRNALGGAVAPCLGNLTSLRYLDISNNHFTGNIASTPLANLTTLQFLSLLNNQLQVPMSFRSFANHSNLKVLLADQNNMVADEPTAFQTWWPKFQLEVFSMSNCMIEEHGNLQLPNFLYFQHDLRDVDLSYCDFGGIRFPHWLLENNTRLEQLYMIDTSIVGPLFLPSHPSFNLKVFDISNNKIHHDIPRNFCSLFPHLEGLFMSKNDLKTDIPPCLGGLRRLQMLDLSHNDLFGEIPEELRMSSSLANLILSNNSLSGKIIPTVYHLIILLEELRLDGNKFEGEISYFSPISIKNLQVLDVSDNDISGELPTWLWDTISLKILDFSKNNFEGPITMQLCKLINLDFLDLSSNHLSGTIPSCSNLQRMRHVHLANNRLSGTLSNVIFKSSPLVTLDLSGNSFTGGIPNWISTLPILSVLLLKENQFDGEFPLQLCKLQSLSIMDFSHNKLSGHLPSCLSNLTLKPSEKSYVDSGGYQFDFFDDVMVHMGLTIYNLTGLVSVYRGYPFTYHEEDVLFSTKGATYTYKGNILDLLSAIDLSCNQLTGIILPGFGNLSEIRGLNLSHNNLTGPIPSTFSELKQIESLDLSYNNLSGRIPSELTEMTSLEVFSVAHNNLSGPLPDRKNQFGTFDESNYEGNPLLCGPPLNKSCNGGNSPTAPNATSSEEEHGHIDMVDFYISFATSYAIIFLTTILVLYINPYWRRACFYFIEDRSIVCYFFIVDSLRQLPCFRRNI